MVVGKMSYYVGHHFADIKTVYNFVVKNVWLHTVDGNTVDWAASSYLVENYRFLVGPGNDNVVPCETGLRPVPVDLYEYIVDEEFPHDFKYSIEYVSGWVPYQKYVPEEGKLYGVDDQLSLDVFKHKETGILAGYLDQDGRNAYVGIAVIEKEHCSELITRSVILDSYLCRMGVTPTLTFFTST